MLGLQSCNISYCTVQTEVDQMVMGKTSAEAQKAQQRLFRTL